MIPRITVEALARSWVGTPYKHQGRQKGVGVDCIGLIWGVAAELGVDNSGVPANYPGTPDGLQLIAGCEKYLVRREGLDRVRGGVAILYGLDKRPQHFAIVGLYGGQPTMIHAFAKRQRVVEHTWDRFWEERLVRMYDFPGVEEWKG